MFFILEANIMTLFL